MVSLPRVARLAAGIGLVGALLLAPGAGTRSLAANDTSSAQGVPGTWVSSITVLNPSTSGASASVVVDFYDANGNIVSGAQQTATIGPGATAFWYVPNIGGLGNGQAYSAVVSSDQKVYATVNLNTKDGTTPQMGETYNGVVGTDAAIQVAVPSVLRNYYGFTSNLVVQNTGSSAASVTVKLIGNGSNGAINYTTPAQAIQPNGSVTIDLAAIGNLGDGFSGGATVVANTGGVAVISNNYTPTISSVAPKYLFSSVNGFAATTGAKTAYLPGLYKNYYGFTSALIIQNADTAPADVTVTYANGATDSVAGLQPGGSQVFYTPNNSGLPGTWQGPAVVTSNRNILAQVNIQASGYSGVGLASYSAFQTGTTKIYAPGLLKAYHGYNSALTIQNVDTFPANVTVTYSNGVNRSVTIQPSQSELFYQPNDSGLPNGFNGGATVVSTNGAKIVGLVNLQGVTGADQLFSTNAFGE